MDTLKSQIEPGQNLNVVLSKLFIQVLKLRFVLQLPFIILWTLKTKVLKRIYTKLPITGVLVEQLLMGTVSAIKLYKNYIFEILGKVFLFYTLGQQLKHVNVQINSHCTLK